MRARVLVAVFAALTTGAVAFGQRIYCPPGTVPRNPAPPATSSGRSGSGCLVAFFDNFNLGEQASRVVALERGKSYWFAANGCPKMGRISLTVSDAAGRVLKSAENYAPSMCFIAPSSGRYTVRVKAMSLMGRYTWGTIDGCFSPSGCKP